MFDARSIRHSPGRHVMRAGACTILLAAALARGAAARAAETAPAPAVSEVTRLDVDGGAYCRDYAARVEALGRQRPERAAEVADLIREGKAQCAAGQIKNGLHRLRMAWATLSGE